MFECQWNFFSGGGGGGGGGNVLVYTNTQLQYLPSSK